MSNGRVQRPDGFRKGCHGGGSDDLAKRDIDFKGSRSAAVPVVLSVAALSGMLESGAACWKAGPGHYSTPAAAVSTPTVAAPAASVTCPQLSCSTPSAKGVCPQTQPRRRITPCPHNVCDINAGDSSSVFLELLGQIKADSRERESERESICLCLSRDKEA